MRWMRAALVLALSLGLCGFAPATRGPSTLEERELVAEIAQKLRADPLSPDLRKQRAWALRWVVEVPDIHVTMCGGFMPWLTAREKYKYARELSAQMTLSSAAFSIENPAVAGDLTRQQFAAVDGTLRAYEAILKRDPKARLAPLDDLLKKRVGGELMRVVVAESRRCKDAVSKAPVRN